MDFSKRKMTEGERIIKLETQMNNIENKVDDGFRVTEERFDKVEKLIEDFIRESEVRFASKWVEKVMWGGGAIVGGTLLLAISQLIIK